MKNYVEKIEALVEKILNLYSNYATPDELSSFKKITEDDVFSVLRKTKPIVMFYGAVAIE